MKWFWYRNHDMDREKKVRFKSGTSLDKHNISVIMVVLYRVVWERPPCKYYKIARFKPIGVEQ